jgi:FAD/FMN-containing dehydrogenase
MNDVSAFVAALGDVPVVTDPRTLQIKSRDMTARFSPVMKDDALGHVADVLVMPRHRDDVLRVARAAAIARMPLVLRGAGTCNFGQGIPLAGGAMIDMTGLDQVLWSRPGRVRAQAGARLMAIDEATRPMGWELRMHSSTKKVATLGGFVGGGHAGVGSCAWGILRDRGNILGLQVVSVEENPRIVELRGDEVNRVHHAYGSNGIITELEMPLAPAWPWREQVVVLPDFMNAVRFAHALATSDGIEKKLISVIGEEIWQLLKPLRPFGRDGHAVVLAMIAEPFVEAFQDLVRDHGGAITVDAAEGAAPYGMPIYELSWGHTRLHVNREHPDIVSNVGLYLDPDLVGAIGRSHARFSRQGLGMHFEVKRFDGQLSFQGSPFFRYRDEAQLAEIMRDMTEDGAMVANNHTFLVKEGGMKSLGGDDAAFKRAMDPLDLMNPGKLRFDAEPPREAAGAALPSPGWRFQDAASAEATESTPA